MKYYGQFDPQLDRYIHETYFPTKRDGFFIEAGAYDGIEDSNCRFFEESMEWQGINIEPDAVLFQRLCKNRPSATNLNIGLTTQERSKTHQAYTSVYSSEDVRTGLGSFSLPQPMKKHYEEGFSLSEYSVEVVSFKDMIESLNFPRIDLFSLDVEGGELEVIDGMKGSSILPHLICVEHARVGMHNLSIALSSLEYHFHSSIHNCSFFRKNYI